METTISKKGKERLVAEIDPELLRELRKDRIEMRRPVNHIVEEILIRHYRSRRRKPTATVTTP